MHIDMQAMNAETAVIIEELSMAFVAEPTMEEVAPATSPTLWQRVPWQQIPWRMVLVSIYLIGVAVYLVKFVCGLASIGMLIRRSKCREMADGTILVTHTKDYSPFSWMRYIIVSERDLQENHDMILAHERAHIRLGHSWDLLFVQLCSIVQWFNPAAWLLKRELEAIHEYEADSATLHEGFDARQYQLRLFEAATGVKYSSFTNNFINCSTKKRIVMMMKKQTSPWALLKALYVLPVALVAVSVISCTSPKEKAPYLKVGLNDVKEYNISDFGKDPALRIIAKSNSLGFKKEITIVDQGASIPNPIETFLKGNPARENLLAEFGLKEEDIDSVRIFFPGESDMCGNIGDNGIIAIYTSNTKGVHLYNKSDESNSATSETQEPTIDPKQPEATEDEVFMVVEEQPMYPGGMEELMKFMRKEIKYPQEAQDKGIQGRVVVQFVVKKDGSIAEANVVKPVDPLLDAEALRIVGLMPNWTPGKQKGEPVNVRFTLPVNFRLAN